MDESKQTVPVSRHNRTDAHKNSQRWWRHAQVLNRFKPDRLSALRGGSRHGVPPLTKRLLVIATLWQLEKANILHWSVSGSINHTPGQDPCPGHPTPP